MGRYPTSVDGRSEGPSSTNGSVSGASDQMRPRQRAYPLPESSNPILRRPRTFAEYRTNGYGPEASNIIHQRQRTEGSESGARIPTKIPSDAYYYTDDPGSHVEAITSSAERHFFHSATAVCTECYRLRLKCDRRMPCGSCLKREVIQRCEYPAAPFESAPVSITRNLDVTHVNGDSPAANTISTTGRPMSRRWTQAGLSSSIDGKIEFESRKRVARGGFCEVFVGRHPTLGRVALKRPKEETFEDFPEEKIRQFKREIRVWKTVVHKFILPYFGLYEEDSKLYMVSPYIGFGNMMEFVKCHRDTANRRQLLAQTAEGLAYLHQREIVHRDLKAANVLVSKDEHALICDFGLSKHTHESTTTAMKNVGTVRWEAPEILAEGQKTRSSDMYAFAMTIVEVLTEDVPFQNKTDIQTLTAVPTHQRPACQPRISPTGEEWGDVWQVATECWGADPNRRLTAWEARERLHRVGEAIKSDEREREPGTTALDKKNRRSALEQPIQEIEPFISALLPHSGVSDIVHHQTYSTSLSGQGSHSFHQSSTTYQDLPVSLGPGYGFTTPVQSIVAFSSIYVPRLGVGHLQKSSNLSTPSTYVPTTFNSGNAPQMHWHPHDVD